MKKPLLERAAVTYFQSRSQRVARPRLGDAVDAVHTLNTHEQAAIKRVERGAITRAAIAGAISAAICAFAELVADPYLPEGAPLLSSARYWLILGGATLGAAVVEIAFLYWDTLRSMHQLALVAGLELFTEGEESSVLVDGLARAALELPNPVEGPHGINPRREASKWRLVLASLAYKAKVGVTNFLVKMLVRRLLGRVFVRSVVTTFIPFVAVPITALWNGIVSYLILREGRIRAMGPSAARAMVATIFDSAGEISQGGRLAARRAVGAAIVRTQDLHPNLVALLDEVTVRSGATPPGEGLDNVEGFLASLPSLPQPELQVVRQVLAVACIIDGRFTAPEKRLWADVLLASGARARVDFAPVEALRVAFARGDPRLEGLLSAVREPAQ